MALWDWFQLRQGAAEGVVEEAEEGGGGFGGVAGAGGELVEGAADREAAEGEVGEAAGGELVADGAIFAEEDVPVEWGEFIGKNAAYYGK